MFDINKKYKIVYKNRNYTKILTCKILEETNQLVRVIDKFNNEIIVGKNSIIESKKLEIGDVKHEKK